MSGDNRDAQRVFDAGVLSLGIPIDGLEIESDVQYAGAAFLSFQLKSFNLAVQTYPQPEEAEEETTTSTTGTTGTSGSTK